jgi:CarD family transcriptional regulator
MLQSDKPLSFREKKMLQRSRHMLITELSICRGCKEAEALDMLQKALMKAAMSMPAEA